MLWAYASTLLYILFAKPYKVRFYPKVFLSYFFWQPLRRGGSWVQFLTPGRRPDFYCFSTRAWCYFPTSISVSPIFFEYMWPNAIVSPFFCSRRFAFLTEIIFLMNPNRFISQTHVYRSTFQKFRNCGSDKSLYTTRHPLSTLHLHTTQVDMYRFELSPSIATLQVILNG